MKDFEHLNLSSVIKARHGLDSSPHHEKAKNLEDTSSESNSAVQKCVQVNLCKHNKILSWK